MNRPSADRERTLTDVVAEYLQAIDAGKPADREEILRRHPSIADDLREFFESQDALGHLVQPTTNFERGPDGKLAQRHSPQRPTREKLEYFGDYELLAEIARGGMGVVYKARQTNLDRTVALKMILAGRLASEQDVRRFYQEAEAAAGLDHPGITPIHEVGQHQGQHFFAMSYVEGPSLAEVLSSGPLPPADAAQVVRSVAEAIAYAHSRGVIHRDLKPANILLAPVDRRRSGGSVVELSPSPEQPLGAGCYEPKVTDFGLAKRTEGTEELTETGQVLGTPSYMPPEQASGDGEATAVSDVYSLGAILYCTLTGLPPFQAASPVDTLMQVIKKDPAPPRHVNSAIPRDLETICMKCLEKDPQRRYRSAQALAEDLERYLSGAPILARPAGPGERALKWGRRHPAVAILSMCLLAALIAGVAVSSAFAVLAERRARAEREARMEARQAQQIAEDQRAEALRQAERAEHQQSLAQRAAERAGTQERLARRRFYSSQMNLAQRAWEAADPRRVLQLLEGQRPEEGDVDLRSFDWFYLWRLCHQNMRWMAPAPADSRWIHSNGRGLLAISPDGETVASGGLDGKVRLRSLSDGSVVKVLDGGRFGSHRADFSPDGKRLAHVASPDGRQVTVWDLDRGESRRLNGLSNCELALFSSNGSQLATLARGRVKLWDTADWRETAILPVKNVEWLAVSRATERLAVAQREGRQVIQLWDISQSPPTLVKSLPSGGGISIKFSPDGKRLAVKDYKGYNSGRSQVIVYDLDTGKHEAHYQAELIDDRSLAFSATGEVAFGTSHGRLVLWQPDTGEHRIYPHSGAVAAVDVSSDGGTMVSLDDGRVLKCWDLTSPPAPATSHPVRLGWTGVPLTYSRDGELLAVSTGEKGLLLFRTADRQLVRSFPTEVRESGWTRDVAISPDGKLIASAAGGWSMRNQPANVRVWEVASGEPLADLQHPAHPFMVEFSPDGGTLATGDSAGNLKLWEVSGFRLRSTSRLGSPIRALSYSPDGQVLAAGTMQRVSLHDAASGKQIRAARIDSSSTRAAAWSPDGSVVAFGLEQGVIRLRDGKTLELKRELQGHATITVSLAYFPDGQTLASASEDGTVKLWDHSTGQERLTMRAGKYLAIAPDGRTLVTARDTENDQMYRQAVVQFWRAATPEEAAPISTLDGADARVLNYQVPTRPILWDAGTR